MVQLKVCTTHQNSIAVKSLVQEEGVNTDEALRRLWAEGAGPFNKNMLLLGCWMPLQVFQASCEGNNLTT